MATTSRPCFSISRGFANPVSAVGPKTYFASRSATLFNYGGEGGIRTPDRLAPMPHLECGTINHSATSPRRQNRGRAPVVGGVNRRGWLARQGAKGENPLPLSLPGLIHGATAMEHLTIPANGAKFHLVRAGRGKP